MKKFISVMVALTLTGCFRSTPTPSARPSSVSTPGSTSPATTGNKLSVGSGYPPEAIESFMRGCMAGQPSSMKGTCSCMIQQIQVKYSYDQYQTISKSGQTEIPGIQEIVANCADNPSPSSTVLPSTSQEPYIKGQDGQFLGVVSNNKVEEKSICNQVGAYGSQVSPTSIRSQTGNYGSQISDLSAYNPNAQKPPIVIQGGQPIRLLTKNTRLQGGLDPDDLLFNTCGR